MGLDRPHRRRVLLGARSREHGASAAGEDCQTPTPFGSGDWVADFDGKLASASDPGKAVEPITTIAWLMWHDLAAPTGNLAAVTHGPAAPTHEPAAVIRDPAVPTHDPAAATDDPAAVTHDPTAATDDPAAVTHDPAAVTHNPAAPTYNPAAVTHEPAAVIHEPAVPTHDPAAVTHDPAVPTHDPAAATDDPAAVTRDPAAVRSRDRQGASGTVYLVGAGPGDPDLLTIRGRRILEQAGAVLYDHLAPEALLAFAPPEAERLYVGKKKSAHAFTQDEICAMLIERPAAVRPWCASKAATLISSGAAAKRPKPSRQPASPSRSCRASPPRWASRLTPACR